MGPAQYQAYKRARRLKKKAMKKVFCSEKFKDSECRTEGVAERQREDKMVGKSKERQIVVSEHMIPVEPEEEFRPKRMGLKINRPFFPRVFKGAKSQVPLSSNYGNSSTHGDDSIPDVSILRVSSRVLEIAQQGSAKCSQQETSKIGKQGISKNEKQVASKTGKQKTPKTVQPISSQTTAQQ